MASSEEDKKSILKRNLTVSGVGGHSAGDLAHCTMPVMSSDFFLGRLEFVAQNVSESLPAQDKREDTRAGMSSDRLSVLLPTSEPSSGSRRNSS